MVYDILTEKLPESKLYNCRSLLVTKSPTLKEFLGMLFEDLGIVPALYLSNAKIARKKIKEGAQNKQPFHFLIIDLGKMTSSELNEVHALYDNCRMDDFYYKAPILFIKDSEIGDSPMEEEETGSTNGDDESNSEDSKSTDENEKQEEKLAGPEKGELDWNTDPMVCVIERPVTSEIIMEKLDGLFLSAYPNGVRNLDVSKTSNYYIVKFPEYLENAIIVELRMVINEIISYSSRPIVFDFEILKLSSYEKIRLVFQILFALKKRDVHYVSIKMERGATEYLKRKGMFEAFNFTDSLEKALHLKAGKQVQKASKSKYVSIDVKIVNPFITATIHSFYNLLKLVLKPQHPIMQQNFNSQNAEFATVIFVESATFNGTMAQIFSKEVFGNFFNKVTQEYNINEVKDVLTYTNFLLSNIFDMAKAELAKNEGYDLNFVSPKIIHGNDNINKQISCGASINIPLLSDIGQIDLLITSETC